MTVLPVPAVGSQENLRRKEGAGCRAQMPPPTRRESSVKDVITVEDLVIEGNVDFNTGNVWRSLDELEDDFTLRTGGGIGLALDSIIGPIALNYGAGNGGRHVVYFSAGVPF